MIPTYAPRPVIRTSKLQTYVATTTNILEYLPFYTEPYCKVFDDNTGDLEIAHLPKIQTHTKAIDVDPHNFQEYVRLGLISVYISNIYVQSTSGHSYKSPDPDYLHQTPRSMAVLSYLHAAFERECRITDFIHLEIADIQ